MLASVLCGSIEMGWNRVADPSELVMTACCSNAQGGPTGTDQRWYDRYCSWSEQHHRPSYCALNKPMARPPGIPGSEPVTAITVSLQNLDGKRESQGCESHLRRHSGKSGPAVRCRDLHRHRATKDHRQQLGCSD